MRSNIESLTSSIFRGVAHGLHEHAPRHFSPDVLINYKCIYVQNVQENYCDLRKAASKKGLRGIQKRSTFWKLFGARSPELGIQELG